MRWSRCTLVLSHPVRRFLRTNGFDRGTLPSEMAPLGCTSWPPVVVWTEWKGQRVHFSHSMWSFKKLQRLACSLGQGAVGRTGGGASDLYTESPSPGGGPWVGGPRTGRRATRAAGAAARTPSARPPPAGEGRGCLPAALAPPQCDGRASIGHWI